MFNLNERIAQWRRQMLAAGIKTPALLDELESHLCEDVEQQAQSGVGTQQAFDAAVQRIGQAHALKLEFKKVGVSIESRFVQLVGIACAIIAGLFSVWMLINLFIVHEANLAEQVLGSVAITLIVLSWRYGDRFLPTIHRQWVRTLTGVLCCIASVGGMILFIKSILPHFLEVRAGADIPVGHLLVSFVWVWTAVAILGTAAYRLDDAARKNSRRHV